MSEPSPTEHFVLIEDGKIANVARSDREAAVIRWQQAKPGREFKKVLELR